MAIRIRQTPYTRSGANPGPYPMHGSEVLAQLGVLAMAGSQQLPGTLGDEPDAADADYSILSYDPGAQDTTTAAGRVRQRLKDLVDGGQDIRLFGVGADFIWSDGSTIEDSAGGAIGDWIFYDTQNCDGDGRWVRGTDGEEVCTSSAGILYHELGHVFLNHPQGSVDDDERAAVAFENDLRSAEGRVDRDPDHWPESDCECPGGCCIVASVATGSPFSAEVHALRRFRDRTLRRTAVGMRFFDALHAEYYRFSVAVSRLLATSETAREQVADGLVRPLVRALELAQRYAASPEDDTALGELVAGEPDEPLPLALDWPGAERLLALAAVGDFLPAGTPRLDPTVAGVVFILREKLPECPHVRWAIVDLLRLYAEARGRSQRGESAADVGRFLCCALDDWAAAMPLETLRETLTPADWAEDLPALAAAFFTSARARRRFGARLLDALPRPLDPRLDTVLRREGYRP